MIADPVASFMPPRATSAQKSVRKIRRGLSQLVASRKPRPGTSSGATALDGRQPPSWLAIKLANLRQFINPDPTIPWWKESAVLAGLLNFVPGLGYLYLGRFLRGLIFLALASAAFLLASRFYLTTTGAWCRWVFAFLLATGVYDAWFVREGSEVTWRNIVFPTIIMFLAVALVRPVVEVASRAWGLRYVTLQEDRGPIKAGDATLFTDDFADQGEPKQGDIVYARGPKIDIVLGEPGDQVQWKEGKMWVNGEQRDDLLPQSHDETMMEFSVTVPQDHYLILPDAHLAGAVTQQQWRQFVLDYGFSHRRDILYRYRDRTAEVLSNGY